MPELGHYGPDVTDANLAIRWQEVPDVLPWYGTASVSRGVIAGHGRGWRERLSQRLGLGRSRHAEGAETSDHSTDVANGDDLIPGWRLPHWHVEEVPEVQVIAA